MSTLAQLEREREAPLPTPQVAARPIGGVRYDWMMALLSALFLGGLYLDGWAHNHGRVDQSFFTPWHAFFYGGFALTALVLGATMALNRRRGISWRQSVPAGYGLALLGVGIFAAGGAGDLVWHTLFGIEEDFEALVSPTHLMLGAGLALIVTGPLRAAWRRAGGEGWRALGPALLSLCLLISTLTFFMMFSHPLMSIIAGARHGHFNDEVGQVAGVISLLVTAALLLGPLFVVLQRWTLPAGALILVWGVNTVAMAILDWGLDYAVYLLGAMLVAVVVCDWLLQRAQAALPAKGPLRVFAFVAPALLFGAYFMALLLTEGSRWSIHLLGGAVVLPGAVGWMLSYVAWPPAGDG
jgi:hypothetical protein